MSTTRTDELRWGEGPQGYSPTDAKWHLHRPIPGPWGTWESLCMRSYVPNRTVAARLTAERPPLEDRCQECDSIETTARMFPDG